jgi:hypothetical protein
VSDASADNTNTPPRPNFPFWTVAAAFVTFFAFLALMWFAYQSSSPLAAPPADTKTEPKVDPAVKLDEVKARNQAALDGIGAKMPLREAHGKLLGTLKGPNDKLPFPTPEPPVVAVPDKKDDKKDGKDEKKDAKDEGKKP